MANSFQVTFDAANPDRLAHFWAKVLGYKLQDPPAGFASWPEFLKTIGYTEEEMDSVDQAGVDKVEDEIRALYNQMLAGWNERKAEEMAAPFTEEAILIGFDGSEMIGQAEIVSTLKQIFADHVTPPYVSKLRS